MKRFVQSGFTLIEVMIVVAIIGILASVALPAYTDYIRRGQLPEAFTYMSDHRIKMEQYFQDNRKYGTGTACGIAVANQKYFNFACSINTSGNGTAGSGYSVTATGASGRAVGYDYTINQAGAKATTKFAGAAVTGKACWAVKAGDC